MEGKHHYFFAVKLPSRVKEAIHQWVIENKQQFPFKRWVHPEDYHITLTFLGFQEKDLLSRAIDTVTDSFINIQPFLLTLNTFGTFGKESEPRIFWLDVEHSSVLKNIQEKVYNQCTNLGLSLDKKPFRPHITIARKWNSSEPFQRSLLNKYNADEPFCFQVDEVVLYETHVDETPKYKVVHTFKLQ